MSAGLLWQDAQPERATILDLPGAQRLS
jgi:hypothetical protein